MDGACGVRKEESGGGLMPKRIQRKRTRGWKMPPDTVYVGRPTKWGNAYPVKEYGESLALKLFRHELLFHRRPDEFLKELRGKDLACWCALDQPCHADVLLEIANAEAA